MNDDKKLAKYLIKHEADYSLIKDKDLIDRLNSYAKVASSHSKTDNIIKNQGEIGKVKKSRKKSCAQFKGKQKELKQQIQESENQNTKLTEAHEVLKAQKELVKLKNCIDGHEVRLEALNKLDEENESLGQKMHNLKNENATLREKTKISTLKHIEYY